MRILRVSTIAATVLAATFASAVPRLAAAADVPAHAAGGVLVGETGMTLYTYDTDPAGGGKSVCNGQCATNWPPLKASADAKASGEWSLVTRDDGSKQWAYKGKPLYYFAKDAKPGDRLGDKVRDVWHVVPY